MFFFVDQGKSRKKKTRNAAGQGAQQNPHAQSMKNARIIHKVSRGLLSVFYAFEIEYFFKLIHLIITLNMESSNDFVTKFILGLFLGLFLFLVVAHVLHLKEPVVIEILVFVVVLLRVELYRLELRMLLAERAI